MGLPLLAAGISFAGGAFKTLMGGLQASKAKREMENFQRQKLRNVTEGMRVSTLGAQLQTQEAQRRFATSVDALRSGGVRGLVGGLSRQEQIQQVGQRQIAADLDRQQMAIEQMRAQDRATIRGMQEERESFDYQMLAGQRAAGRQALYSGVGDMVSAGAFAAMNMGDENGDTGGTGGSAPPPPSVVTGQNYVPTRRGGKATETDLFLNNFGFTQSYMKPEGE
jgi:hypothetical protein